MSAPILALDKISKRFGAIVIANNIDLALSEGELLGIIGPNGAGKTSLFGIINGILAPDFRARALRRQRHYPHATGATLPARHRPLIPDSAAVRRHERV